MSATSLSRKAIDSGWQFKQADLDEDFLPVAQFPTTNHLDLIHHGKIPDPTLDLNAPKVQWVGEKEWLYKTSFNCDTLSKAENPVRHVLVFEGLDTHCRITLNGQFLLRADNMFLEWRVDVTDKIRSERNELELYFESTFLVGKQLEKNQGFKNLYWNGDSSRMNTRKVPCHYGWDWGPTLLTAGPWRPVYLETYINRITDLGVDVEVADTLESATVTATIELEGDDSNERTTNVELVDPSGSRVGQSTIKGNDRCQFTVKKPALWYPNGYGEQPLYTVKATIEGGLATVSRRIGLRLSELIQRPIPGKPGLTFFFRVNNIPIYCQGTDWIPPDVFLPRMTPQRYRDWVALAAEGNQNMIRVWGGGVYEDNAFYDSCDELGILIWQDYMMGCGSYPVNDQLLASIKAEAEYNVRRMRHHSCIVLWCGNNEDHWFAESLHLEYNMNDKNPENWLKSNWPARYYYEVLLKDITEKLVPRVPYHFSSPYGGSSSNDPTVGDIHSWRVWMADQPRYPYQDYEKLTGRFVSEFGMKAYPVMRTMKSLISDPEQRHPQSRTLDAWHMADEDQRTIAMYLVDGLRHGNDLEAYIWASQINQAESSDFSLRAFRRLWRGPSREECAGCLIWQLNDCFPAVSWSLADSFMRPKLAYYVTKRDYAPILIGCTRRVDEKAANEFTKVFVDRSTYAEVWASNLTTAPVDMELDILFITISGGNHVHHINQTVTLAANRSVELCRKAFPDENKHDPTGLVVQTRLLDPKDKNKVIARYTEFPQPLRHHDFSMVRVHIKQLAGSSYALSVSGGVAKAVEFSIETDDAQLADACVLSDNCLDLVPGDEQIINVKMVGKIEVPKGGLKVMERHYGQ